MRPTARNMIRVYHRWISGNPHKGVAAGWRPVGPKADAVDRYRYWVQKARQEARWDKIDVRPWKDAEGDYESSDAIVCEHCLSGDRLVMLVRPGVVSGHENGDWVCADCEPRLMDTFIEIGLRKLLPS